MMRGAVTVHAAGVDGGGGAGAMVRSQGERTFGRIHCVMTRLIPDRDLNLPLRKAAAAAAHHLWQHPIGEANQTVSLAHPHPLQYCHHWMRLEPRGGWGSGRHGEKNPTRHLPLLRHHRSLTLLGQTQTGFFLCPCHRLRRQEGS